MGRRRDRTKRGRTKSIKDLPSNVQTILIQISKFTDIGLFGSYLKGDWVEGESDLDIAIKNCKTWAAVIENISKHHNIKIDAREFFDNERILIIKR